MKAWCGLNPSCRLRWSLRFRLQRQGITLGHERQGSAVRRTAWTIPAFAGLGRSKQGATPAEQHHRQRFFSVARPLNSTIVIG
jgi:hypothetical protein